MTTTHYQVYLPPTIVPLSQFQASQHLPISFQNLPTPSSAESFSQSFSQRRRSVLSSLAFSHQTGLESPVEIAQGGVYTSRDIASSRRKGKRRADTNEQSQESFESSGSRSRRESGRLRAKARLLYHDDVHIQHGNTTTATNAVHPNATASVDDPESLGSSQSIKRSARHTRARADISVDSPEGSGSRRRSGRLARPADDSLLDALPVGLNTTDSLLSLNTTLSQTSFPPTAVQGDMSMAYLPKWIIPLSRLITLQSLLTRSRTTEDRKSVSVIVCVTSVDTPVLRKRKEERARGMEGTLWVGKWDVIAPPTSDQGEAGCEVRLWESCARDWGNDRIRRGDVVLLENVEFKPATRKDKAQLILSPTPSHTPKPVILYRTLPRYTGKSDYIHANQSRGKMVVEDKVLRPDLRLSRSDAGVRRVGEVARWFAQWLGGEPP